jgi:hypothetical protein
MTTATAAKPRKIQSPKYPGWTIERTGQADYLMTRPGGIFAISVTHSEAHGWTGELMTMQRRDGFKSWEPARTPFAHSVLGCTAEADRREKAIARYQAKPLTK